MSVTIASAVYWADWLNSTDTTFQVRAKSNRAWITEDQEIIPANESRIVGSGTITSLRPTLPAITLPSTSAGLDDQTAKWTVTLHRTGKASIVSTVLADFPLPDSFEPSTTWAAIKINKNGKQPLRDTSVYTKVEVNNLIALTLPNSFRIALSPVPTYDLASSVLAVGMIVTIPQVTVPTGKQFDAIRIDGIGRPLTLSTGGGSMGVSSYLESGSGSAADTALYPMVANGINHGPGTVKAIHAYAGGSGTSTGVIVAVNAQVQPVATSGISAGIQISSTGVANKSAGIVFGQTGSSHFAYGIDALGIAGTTFTNGFMRLQNNSPIVGRNAANTADVNIVKLNSSNEIEFGTHLRMDVLNPTIFLGSNANGWQILGGNAPFRVIKNAVGEPFNILDDGTVKALTNDMEVTTQGKGLILRATDGANRFRLTVNNAGTLAITVV